MFNIIVVGAGGFGREVYQWSKVSFSPEEYQIKGFLDDNENALDQKGIDLPILGGIIKHSKEYQIQVNDRFIIGIGDLSIKKTLIRALEQRGARFISLIHPTAVVSETAKLGRGVVICPFATISDHVTLDDYAMVNFYASCGHDSRVGKYSILSPYATLNGHAIIENEVFMATHSTVTINCRIGARTKINANSVAMKSCPEGSFIYGVPGKMQRLFHTS
jgi:sugar O-acyltransferase (sialic acid O-acetyltransferase NeuD family)